MIDKNQNRFSVAPKPISKIKDTVGAGDGFSAVILMGIINQWDKQKILEKAAEYASKICQVQGAIFDEREL